MIRALQYAIAALLIGAAVATLAMSADAVPIWATSVATGATRAEPGKCQKCIRRCEKLYCEDVPTPAPTRSPTPPTHSFGKTCDYELKTTRTITFPVQDEPILICHTPPQGEVTLGGASPFIEVQTQNHGNATCADFWLQMYSPNGAISEPSVGAQPGAIMQRVHGRYVIAVYLRQANNEACQTLTFTVR